jgi:hypothetical protein
VRLRLSCCLVASSLLIAAADASAVEAGPGAAYYAGSSSTDPHVEVSLKVVEGEARRLLMAGGTRCEYPSGKREDRSFQAPLGHAQLNARGRFHTSERSPGLYRARMGGKVADAATHGIARFASGGSFEPGPLCDAGPIRYRIARVSREEWRAFRSSPYA